MSSDDGKNFIMKIHKFLIILDFVQICVSIQANISIDKGVTDPITLRNKRQLPEYTRWRMEQGTTKGEFIVKVDDDAFNQIAPVSNEVLAINIQSGTPAVDRIIVGGAMVPLVQTTVLAIETPIEYTRFVPPTTVRPTAGIADHMYSQMKTIEGHNPPFSLVKHANRDESPPAGPQFITRTPALAQQYAPITPVAFFPRAGESPLTPPSVTPPTRSPFIEHTRTYSKTEDLNMLQPLLEDAKDLKDFLAPVERDESQSDIKVTRTESNSFPTRSEQTTDVDLDAYHLMFYNDEDNEVGEDKRKNDEIEDGDNKTGRQETTTTNEDTEDETGINIDITESTTKIEKINFKTTTVENNTLSTSDYIPVIVRKSMRPKSEGAQRQPICSLLKLTPLSFSKPLTLPEITVQLKKWTDNSPLAKIIDITANNLTTMDNPIHMIIVDDPSSGQVVSAKDIVMIVAGIQGRDHHAVTAAMYVLYQLLERTDAHADLLRKYRFWIIPVFNPDGYDYSMTFTQRREWTKNLHQSWELYDGQRSCKECESFGLRCIVQPCYGVHLDRNFEYQWIPAEELRAEHPCGDLYAGSRQLSERETRALTIFLHDQRTPISMFIAFKEGDVLGVMYPYSHTRKKRAFDSNYRKRASRAASAAYSISGRPYVAGQTSEFLPLYAGGMEDWVDGHLGIDNTYTIMMFRPTDSYNAKLMTELRCQSSATMNGETRVGMSVMKHVVHEAYAAMDTLLLESGEPLTVEALTPLARAAAEKIFPSSLVFLAAIAIFNS